jgi:hypothetical protein
MKGVFYSFWLISPQGIYMKAIYLVLCVLVALSGIAVADTFSWEEDEYFEYGDGYYGCCCMPMFALAAVGAFALHAKR